MWMTDILKLVGDIQEVNSKNWLLPNIKGPKDHDIVLVVTIDLRSHMCGLIISRVYTPVAIWK